MRNLRQRAGQFGVAVGLLNLIGGVVWATAGLPSRAQVPPPGQVLPLDQIAPPQLPTQSPLRPLATDLPEAATELTLTLEQVSFDASDLTDRVQGMVKAATPYDVEAPPYLNGAPTHLQFTFRNPVTDLFPNSYPSVGRLYIYPVGGWRSLYVGHQRELRDINRLLGRLRSLIIQRPVYIGEELAILPALEATQVLRSQVKYLNFYGGSGVRFLTTYNQDASPIARANLFYTFQGMSSDGKYYISFYHPILSGVLPESVANLVTPDNYEAFVANYQDYIQRTTQQINMQDSASFAPTLTQLDTMVRSLKIMPTPSPRPALTPTP